MNRPVENARCWRVFYTQPRAEKKCEARLAEKGVEVLLPKRVELRQWKDRKKRVEEPLFRNYIFACVDEQERLDVLRTEGIVRSVAFGGQIAKVPEEEIEQLKILQRYPELLENTDYLRPDIGTDVRVDEGPLQGLRGTVLGYRGGRYLIVRVESIRQAIRIQVPTAWVEAGLQFALK